MTKDFEEFIKNFKPEFGNERHIRILEDIEKVREKERLVKGKLQNQKAIKRKLDEIDRAEKNIMFILKQNG